MEVNCSEFAEDSIQFFLWSGISDTLIGDCFIAMNKIYLEMTAIVIVFNRNWLFNMQIGESRSKGSLETAP